ncbi:MAG: acetylxylan esterase [Bacteroidales bacterium]|nr:acetylxylan esterase [Bacteroidales bacterium]
MVYRRDFLRKPGIAIIVLILIFQIYNAAAQSDNSWRASTQTIEKLSKSGSEFNYYEEKVPSYTLPDVLTTIDGRKVNNSSLWTKVRRPEILELFRENVFGRVPETPYEKSFKVVNLDKKAMDGAATLKQVDITITATGKSLVIHLTLFTPNKTQKPVPAFLLIDNRGPANTDPSRKVKSEFWPVEEAIARGYGMAVFSNADVDPDNFDDFKNGIHALLDKNPRPDDAWGTIGAWAWGASRCMDYLVTDKDIAGDKIAVVGHSRGGKTALWAGAEDTRFAMVVSNESGAGGAALARRRFGETVGRINTAFPHWFCSNYKKFSNNEDALPVDMHMLLALIAPRALYVDCASDDLWGDPRGSYLSLYNAVPVFNLSGTNSVIPEAMPPLNKQVMSGEVAYHIRDGVHNMLLKDWSWFMDFADVVLKK